MRRLSYTLILEPAEDDKATLTLTPHGKKELSATAELVPLLNMLKTTLGDDYTKAFGKE